MTNDTKALPERILAWVYDEWKSAWNVDPEESPPDAVTYVRADLALAAQGALIERAATILEERGSDGWAENVMAEYASVMAESIRDLSPDATAALEAVRRDAVRQEREAVVAWLLDAAGEGMCPPEVSKLLRHEANGIKRGLHTVQDSGSDKE